MFPVKYKMLTDLHIMTEMMMMMPRPSQSIQFLMILKDQRRKEE